MANIAEVQKSELAGKTKLTAVNVFANGRQVQAFVQLQHDARGRAVLPASHLNQILSNMGISARGATYSIGWIMNAQTTSPSHRATKQDLSDNKAKIMQAIYAQMNSQKIWIGLFQKHKDPASIRNVALAIGKLSGLVAAYDAVGGARTEYINLLMAEMDTLWEEIQEIPLRKSND